MEHKEACAKRIGESMEHDEQGRRILEKDEQATDLKEGIHRSLMN